MRGLWSVVSVHVLPSMKGWNLLATRYPANSSLSKALYMVSAREKWHEKKHTRAELLQGGTCATLAGVADNTQWCVEGGVVEKSR